MKIQAINAHHLSCELAHTTWNSVTAHPTRPSLVVEVVTADGVSGWGSASGGARGGEDRLAAAAELLPGRDLRHWGILLAALTPRHGRGRNVVAAIETALLDAPGPLPGHLRRRVAGHPSPPRPRLRLRRLLLRSPPRPPRPPAAGNRGRPRAAVSAITR